MSFYLGHHEFLSPFCLRLYGRVGLASSISFSCERGNIGEKGEDGFLVKAEVSSTRTYVNAADALSSFPIIINPIIRPFDFLTWVLQGDLLLQVPLQIPSAN